MAAPSLSQIRVLQMLLVAPTTCGVVVVFSNDSEVQGWLGGFTVAATLHFLVTLPASRVCGGCRCTSLLWMVSLCARVMLLLCCHDWCVCCRFVLEDYAMEMVIPWWCDESLWVQRLLVWTVKTASVVVVCVNGGGLLWCFYCMWR